MAGRRNGWSSLVPGLLAMAGMLAAAAAVLIFARVGALHGSTYRLHLVTAEARGILKGSEVWLEGQRVGLVAGIRFMPPSADTLDRVDVQLDVLSTYSRFIRRDSYAQIRSGGSLIGTPVVYVASGTPAQPPLGADDTIASKGQLDPEDVTSRVALASRQFPEIISNVRQISRELASVNARMTDQESHLTVAVVGGRAMRLGSRALSGPGTLGQALANRERLTARARTAVARADSIMTALRAPTGPVARVRNDSLLLRQLTDVRNEISIVRVQLAESRGSAGRFLHDSAIVRQLGAFEREIGVLMADVKRDPARYIAF